MLREKCNRPMLLIERQKAMLLEVYKCIHELGPRYRHGMFSQKSRAYDYRDPSILTLSKYNTITYGIFFMYEGAKLWNSISNGIKTIENISEFKTLLKKWNGTPCICKNCFICTISYYVIEGFNGMLYVFHFIYCHPVIYSLSLFIIIFG